MSGITKSAGPKLSPGGYSDRLKWDFYKSSHIFQYVIKHKLQQEIEAANYAGHVDYPDLVLAAFGIQKSLQHSLHKTYNKYLPDKRQKFFHANAPRCMYIHNGGR
jgi:hypothetical protein